MRWLEKIKKAFNDISYCKENLDSLPYILRKQWLEEKMLFCKEVGVSQKKYSNHEIIVSLTSYGKRIDYVAYTIESIMQQTYKPNRIVLWLYSEDFNRDLPEVLKLQQRRGLEILEYKRDIRSYKKLIPSLKEFPEAAIITLDDDLLYDYDIIERLIKSYVKYPNAISACRTHTMTMDCDSIILPYRKWKHYCSDATNNNLLFATSGGGTLFPPNSLGEEVKNEDVFMDICPTADDIWFKAMAIFYKTRIVKVPTKDKRGNEFIGIPEVQDTALYIVNTGVHGANDIQLQEVFKKYNLRINQ